MGELPAGYASAPPPPPPIAPARNFLRSVPQPDYETELETRSVSDAPKSSPTANAGLPVAPTAPVAISPYPPAPMPTSAAATVSHEESSPAAAKEGSYIVSEEIVSETVIAPGTPLPPPVKPRVISGEVPPAANSSQGTPPVGSTLPPIASETVAGADPSEMAGVENAVQMEGEVDGSGGIALENAGQYSMPAPNIPSVTSEVTPDPSLVEAPVVGEASPTAIGWGMAQYKTERKKWSGEIAAGLNGATGNTERFNSRFGFQGKRDTKRNEFFFNATYANSTADGEEVENKFLQDLRNNWKLGESKWGIYVFENIVYDTFQVWDIRLVLGSGLSYDFLRNDRTKLQSRLGAGASKEVGGPDEQWVPEGNSALQFSHKLTDRQSLTAQIEYFPSFVELRELRVNSQAAWECLIDPAHGLNLRVGFMDRYQGISEGAKNNDLDYFCELVMKF